MEGYWRIQWEEILSRFYVVSLSVLKPLDFFKKMSHVSYLAKNERILEDSMGGDPLPDFPKSTRMIAAMGH